MANGGGQESRELIEQMAWHVRELGLHNRSTASLYPPQDMVDVLFSAFIYTDTQVFFFLLIPYALRSTLSVVQHLSSFISR